MGIFKVKIQGDFLEFQSYFILSERKNPELQVSLFSKHHLSPFKAITMGSCIYFRISLTASSISIHGGIWLINIIFIKLIHARHSTLKEELYIILLKFWVHFFGFPTYNSSSNWICCGILTVSGAELTWLLIEAASSNLKKDSAILKLLSPSKFSCLVWKQQVWNDHAFPFFI